MNWCDKGRMITIFDKWFRAFKSDEKTLAGNCIYMIPTRARTIFKKELMGEKLTKTDIKYMDNHRIKPEAE